MISRSIIFILSICSTPVFAANPIEYFKNSLTLSPIDRVHTPISDVRLVETGPWQDFVNWNAGMEMATYIHIDYPRWTYPTWEYPIEIDHEGMTYKCTGRLSYLGYRDLEMRSVSILGCDQAPYPVGHVQEKKVTPNQPSYGLPNICNLIPASQMTAEEIHLCTK